MQFSPSAIHGNSSFLIPISHYRNRILIASPNLQLRDIVRDRIFSPKDMMKPRTRFKISAETKTIWARFYSQDFSTIWYLKLWLKLWASKLKMTSFNLPRRKLKIYMLAMKVSHWWISAIQCRLKYIIHPSSNRWRLRWRRASWRASWIMNSWISAQARHLKCLINQKWLAWKKVACKKVVSRTHSKV